MSRRFAPTAAVALALTVITVAHAPARAQAVGAISGEGLTFEQAQRKFPGLRRVTFEKADLNGDGVIEANELPVLQGLYQQLNQSR